MSKIILKKNSTDYPLLTMPNHYPADRVYLDGDTTKTVQDKVARKADLTNLDLTGTTNTTGSTIASGTYFYLNGVLVRAKATIANGATFTLNTNYEVVTVGDALDDKVSKSGDTMSGNLIIDQANGTTSTAGSSAIKIGNATPTGTAGNSYGIIHLCSNTTYRANITAPNFTADRNINMPNAAGTLALKEDFAWTAMPVTVGANVSSASAYYCKIGDRYLIKGSFKTTGISANVGIFSGGSISGQGAMAYSCPYASAGTATYLNGMLIANAAISSSGGNNYVFCGII